MERTYIVNGQRYALDEEEIEELEELLEDEYGGEKFYYLSDSIRERLIKEVQKPEY